MKKNRAVAVAVVVAVWYIKVTIVTLSVTNRHTLSTPPYYVGGLDRCVIGNYSAGAVAPVSTTAVASGGGRYG